ncbi:Tetratricopeptide TPR_2 repeat-containing protein [Thalassoporum mexicanum PCC 7367]|uniref:tetratricopeptide repeat protein n=1 Tax=Thalassoporum mexicanum TaxID=3457544 RepID=UPI00029FC29C|nr:tetratricopeptide repeat protein [Pseudanabaena sp. PCC 7367]AFY71278.1 Tetratricopeptide TPR_2 repeat-containing protein [Pseudanabaena sp. PCC 7367]
MSPSPEQPNHANLELATACLVTGNQLFGQDQVDAAIAKYQEAILLNQNYFQAHFNLGIALRQKGDLDAAQAAYQKALAIEPDSAKAHYSLGNVLMDAKQLAAAIESYQRAIELDPDLDSAHFMLGYADQASGQLEQAIFHYQKAIDANPQRGDAYYNLGLAYGSRKQTNLAIANLEQAVQLLPNDLKIRISLAKEYKKAGNFQAAQPHYEQAIAIDPDHAETQFQLGYVYHQTNQLDAAIRQYQRAIALDPNYELTYSNLGAILRRQGDLEAAIAMYEQALEVNPRNTSALYNLGNAFLAKHQIEDAIACYRQVVEIKPDAIHAHQDLANLLFKTDIVAARTAAEDYHRGCAHIDPIATLANLISTNIKSDYYDVALKYFLEVEAHVYANLSQLNPEQLKTLYRGLLFFVPFLRDDAIVNAKFFTTIATAYREKVVKPQVEAAIGQLAANGIQPPRYELEQTHSNQSEQSRNKPNQEPLRIGFLSDNFKRHSVGWCSADFITKLRDFTPELYFYAADIFTDDDQTQKFRQVAKGFYKFTGEKAEDRLAPMLKQMWQDNLDVLIELDSTMSPLPAYILYASPAKVCMSWPGFEAPFISAKHYFICDRYTQPADRDQYYLEKLFRVPHSHMAIAGFKSLTIDRAAERQKLGITDQQVVYLYAAPAQKSNPASIAAQAQILAQVPNSIILRKGAQDLDTAKALYAEYCDPLAVSSDRIIFLPRTNTEEEHRIIYQIADVGLDSYPYNGGTHNLESLWFNLPVVTLVGDQSFARMGYSFVATIGLSDKKAGIAQNWHEYIAEAVRLGGDRDLRNSLKAQLAKSKQPESLSPLWNPAKFAHDLYNQLAQMVQKNPIERSSKSENLTNPVTVKAVKVAKSTSESFKQLAQETAKILSQLEQNPVNPNLIGQLRSLRRRIAEQWLILPTNQLANAYRGDLGKAHAQLLHSELRLRALTVEDEQILQDLYQRINTGIDPGIDPNINNPKNNHAPTAATSPPSQVTDSLRGLIALTLFKYPHQLAIAVDHLFALLMAAPHWLFGGLLQFCLEAPVMFMEVGEGDRYCQFVSHLVSFLKQQISKYLQPRHNLDHIEDVDNPERQFWQNVSRQFVLNSYFVPAYFNQQNLRQLYQDRAAIARTSLQANGYQLDWQFAPRPSDRQKIRLGVLKQNYNPYTETYSTLPLFEHLDRDRFEIFLYATTPSDHPFAKYCQGLGDRFIPLPTNPKQQAELIRQHDLDIMAIGTNITAAIEPITVLALHRLARVQLTNFCSPVTTGSPNMDYYISGQLCEPVTDLDSVANSENFNTSEDIDTSEHFDDSGDSGDSGDSKDSDRSPAVLDAHTNQHKQHNQNNQNNQQSPELLSQPAIDHSTTLPITTSPHYQEKLITLTGVGYCFNYQPIAPTPGRLRPGRASWGANPEAIVFISGANFYKILPELRHAWAKVLAAVPNSILVLYPFGGNWRRKYPIQTFVSHLLEVLAWYGVKPERLVTLRNIPTRADVKVCLQQADIYLDSFPYGGANSTIDPLEVGLPTVAMDGECLRNQQGAALLRQLGLDGLIVNNEAEYIDRAVQLATDVNLRHNFSQKIRQAMQPTPLFLDSKAYAGQLEPIFEQMITQWQLKQEQKQDHDRQDQHLDSLNDPLEPQKKK